LKRLAALKQFDVSSGDATCIPPYDDLEVKESRTQPLLPGATKPWLAEQKLRQEKRMIVCLINYGKAKGGIFKVRATVEHF
jgi:hypothetical protein